MFLKSDQAKVDQELTCYAHCLNQALISMAKSDFETAAAYHENVARALHQLQKYKDNKLSKGMIARLMRTLEQEEHNNKLLTIIKSGPIK